VNYDISLVLTITVTCYLRAPSSGDHLFTRVAISRPPQRWGEIKAKKKGSNPKQKNWFEKTNLF